MPTTTPIAPPRPVAASGQPLQLSGMRPVTATTTPSAMRWSIGAQPSDAKVLRPPANVDVTSSIAKAPEPVAEPVKVAEAPAASVQRKVEATPAKVQAPEPVRAVSHQAAVVASGKWVIQLGATDDEGKAKEILARARAKASGSLASASPFTEKVEKGGSTLFRARFAGFDDSKDAQNACAQLKRGGFSCFATRS
jgi:D-alanyl-D-alanine carboxypeptidase